ncbi:MAG: cysteine hydrolase family protein [Desulfovibrio sp.]
MDVQNDYFPGGRMALPGAQLAGAEAARLLTAWRASGRPVLHVRHESVRPGATFFLPGSTGAEICPQVAPLAGEAVITKHFPNSFRETGLERALRGQGISRLVLVGMMTNMCIDTTVRAAFDLGFDCVVAHDACAAAPLAFGGLELDAEQVHAAYMAALGAVFARELPTADFLEGVRAATGRD